jgi:hypothetical protein
MLNFHFYIENLTKFNQKLTKLVEFTIEKYIFPKHFSISLSKNGEISPEKKNIEDLFHMKLEVLWLVFSRVVLHNCFP